MDTHKKLTPEEVRIWRRKTVMIGIWVPVLAALTMFLFRKDEMLWPFVDQSRLETTRGQIISSTVDYRTGMRSSGWYFIIQYQYQVDGEIYLSDRVHYGYSGSKDRSYAENHVAKYPVGMDVVVYYDAAQPDKSVLEPSIKTYSSLYFIGYAMIFGACLAALSFWIR